MFDYIKVSSLALALVLCSGGACVRQSPPDDSGDSTPQPDDDPVCTLTDLALVPISAGSFTMGALEIESQDYTDEDPHTVTLTGDYEIGSLEVTQAQYESCMGENPSALVSCGSDCPVESLTWHQAAAFTNALSRGASLDTCYTCTGSGDATRCVSAGDPYGCTGYRLPTEAEWEYATRAGTHTAFTNGGNIPDHKEFECSLSWPLDNGAILAEWAWFCGSSEGRAYPVGQLEVNAWGLYDVHGNVWEWIHDAYAPYDGDATDPLGPDDGDRVMRGGSWADAPINTRSARRDHADDSYIHASIGLRLARSTP